MGISSLLFSKVFPAPGASNGSPMDAQKATQESWRRLREAHAREAQASNGQSGKEPEQPGTPASAPASPAAVTPAAEE